MRINEIEWLYVINIYLYLVRWTLGVLSNSILLNSFSFFLHSDQLVTDWFLLLRAIVNRFVKHPLYTSARWPCQQPFLAKSTSQDRKRDKWLLRVHLPSHLTPLTFLIDHKITTTINSKGNSQICLAEPPPFRNHFQQSTKRKYWEKKNASCARFPECRKQKKKISSSASLLATPHLLSQRGGKRIARDDLLWAAHVAVWEVYHKEICHHQSQQSENSHHHRSSSHQLCPDKDKKHGKLSFEQSKTWGFH